MEMTADDMSGRLEKGRALLDYLGDRTNRSLIGKGKRWAGIGDGLALNEFYLYHIEEITYEEKAPRKEALENILGTFRGMDGISFIYMILGNARKVDFYFGVAKDKSCGEEKAFSPENVGTGILFPSIKGNFRGSLISKVGPEEKNVITQRLQQAHAAGILEGVPGIDKDNEDLQGVDRLIDVMSGGDFGFVVIARPYTEDDVNCVEAGLHQLSDALSPLGRYTLQQTQTSGTNTNDSDAVAKATQNGKSTQESHSTSNAVNDVKTNDTRHEESNQSQYSRNEGTNEQWGNSKGMNKNNDTESAGNSYSEGNSIQNQNNFCYTNSVSESKSASISTSAVNNGSSYSKTSSQSESYSVNASHSKGRVSSEVVSTTAQMEIEMKAGTDWLKYVDEVLLPRLDDGRGKGLFQSCTYVFSENRAMLLRLANTAISLYSGPVGNKSALFFKEFQDKTSDSGCMTALKNLQIPAAIRGKEVPDYKVTAFSRYEKGRLSLCGNWLSTNELALLTGLPHKEVIGLSLKEEVEFGLNIKDDIPAERRIELGSLVQCGDIKDNVPIFLDRDNLDKHTFVTGVTGSGKTTTCQNILTHCDLPFLVIEPAKTEYRALKEKVPDLLFFTPGKQDVAPFFLNPFELFPGESITSRADMVKATFEASFDMDAAIPQIMEAAVYRAYENKGWDVGSDTWNGKDEHDEDGPFADGVYAFPTLADFKNAVRENIEQQGFDERLRDEYLGSINARIQSLMLGAKGMMFNTPRSVDFADLINRKVVIELEEIKSGEEKSLIMGFILTSLMQAVKAEHNARSQQNSAFRHITLVEEAHRLLSRYSPGDSINKKHGVEVFANMLAEVRKYGESLIIADQIPDKMTPEVLKNTNTKIVHKLFARDDKEAIGNTIDLEDKQKAFLSKLAPGRAVVFTQGWGRAVQVQVREEKGCSGIQEVSPEEIAAISLKYYSEERTVRRGVLRGLRQWGKVTEREVGDYLWLQQNDGGMLALYQKMVTDFGYPGYQLMRKFANVLQRMKEHVAEERIYQYFYWNSYEEMDAFRWNKLKAFLEEVLHNVDMQYTIIQYKPLQIRYH